MVAIIDATPGLSHQLRDVIVKLIRQVRQEPGCVVLVPYEQHGTPRRFFLYDVYRDLDAFKDHPRTDPQELLGGPLGPGQRLLIAAEAVVGPTPGALAPDSRPSRGRPTSRTAASPRGAQTGDIRRPIT
jgi:hypothetical protein